MKRKITGELLNWKQNGARQPLLIYGARQVGKSYAVDAFGQENYKNLVTVNFEESPLAKNAFLTSLAPKDVIRSLESILHVSIDPENTLLFFDEVQKCPPALTSLKYFAEGAAAGGCRYQVAAAGSLLGVTLEREQNDRLYTFPVGKVQEIITYPLDFEEFLWAIDHQWLAEQIRISYRQNSPLEETAHQRALELYRRFLVVGGMPGVVSQLLAGQDHREQQKNILNTYLADMTKYSERKQGLRNIDTYNSIAAQLAQERENKRFIFSKIDKTTNGSRDYRDSVIWLVQAKIALRCVKSSRGDQPLRASEDKSNFKLYMSDTGLLCRQLGVTEANLDIFDQNYRGAVTENFVACALNSKIQLLGSDLHYWKAGEKSESAEVDFIITTDEGNIPIEVKSSSRVRSRSLNVYVKKYAPKYSLRLSAKNFGFENGVKAVPLYAAFCIEEMR
jgi:predicted AAA+ superfamily ATPase